MGAVRKLMKVLQLPQEYDTRVRPEINVTKFLQSWNRKLKMDDRGNLSILNPGTPLVCAHMDTVQHSDSTSTIKQHGLKVENRKISVNKPAGVNRGSILGGDDRCGVALVMELYEQFRDNISILFTTQEEVGAKGAQFFYENNPKFFDQLPYCIVLDRRGKGDIIGTNNCYCSQEFEDAVYKLLKPFGYSPAIGSLSDANVFRFKTNCFNMSVGYHDPHSHSEHVNIDDFLNALEAATEVLNHLEGEFEIFTVKKVTSRKEYPQPKKNRRGRNNESLIGRFFGGGGPTEDEEYGEEGEIIDADTPEDMKLGYNEAYQNPAANNLIRDNDEYCLRPLAGYEFIAKDPDNENDFRTKPVYSNKQQRLPLGDGSDAITINNFHLDVKKATDLWVKVDGKNHKVHLEKGKHFFYPVSGTSHV